MTTFRRLPIRLRLTMAFAGVLTTVVVAGGVLLYSEFARDLDDQIDRDLDTRLVQLAALAAEEQDPERVLAESGVEVAQVYGDDGRLLASTPAVAGARLLDAGQVRGAAREGLQVERADTPAGAARLRAGDARSSDGRPLVVVAGEDLARRDGALERLRELLFIGGPLALLLATYAGYQVARAALRPVDRMRVRAERITERDTTERLPVPSTRDEIEALGHTLNDLLARLDAALVRERRLLSDASHELRTPLAVLRTEVQLALRGERDPGELRAALESAGQEAERLSRLADDLLVLARADQGRLPVRGEPLDAGELLDAAARRSAGAARAAGRSVVPDTDSGPGVVVVADPDRAAQALDNLIANALAHGDGLVTIGARKVEQRVELHVTDQGEGFPDELLERAFDRFSRGDAARSGEGTGLGLAIVAAIADAHGGDVGARSPPAGGADVWISLPAA